MGVFNGAQVESDGQSEGRLSRACCASSRSPCQPNIWHGDGREEDEAEEEEKNEDDDFADVVREALVSNDESHSDLESSTPVMVRGWGAANLTVREI